MNDRDRLAECRANGCRGCLGAQMTCGHSFQCCLDPEISHHRCAAMWTPLLMALFMAATAFTVVLLLMGRSA